MTENRSLMRQAADEAIKGPARMCLNEAVREFMRLLIFAALEDVKGNVSLAARRLRITKRGMNALIIDHNLLLAAHNLRTGRGQQKALRFMRKPPEGIWVDAPKGATA